MERKGYKKGGAVAAPEVAASKPVKSVVKKAGAGSGLGRIEKAKKAKKK